MNSDPEHWDGTERRTAALIAQSYRTDRRTTPIPMIVLIVAAVAIALFELGALWGHTIMTDRINEAEAHNEAFRRAITCYVVRVTQGKATPDILTECGFIESPVPIEGGN